MSRVWDMGFGGGGDLFGYTDDGDGRLLNDGAKSYLWEMQGWLCGVTSAGNHYQYIYDAEGRLVTTASRPDAQCGLNTTTLADYVVDQFGRQITEADGSAHWRHTNVYANGELLATYDSAGLHYALNDWLGDKRVQALASSTGTTVEETCWNLPFNDGFGCSGTGTDATEQHYTGKEHDKYASQLDHLGARSYTGYSARFLSPDPTQLYYADPANPQSLNLYSYVRNNPLTNIDPSGLDCVYFNADGTGIDTDDSGNVIGIDHKSNSADCGATGGDWVNGTTYSDWISQAANGTFNIGSTDNSNTYWSNVFAPGTQSDGTTCLGNCTSVNGYSQISNSGLLSQLGDNINTQSQMLKWAVRQRTPVPGWQKFIIAGGNTNWCGQGGMGTPTNSTDWGCAVHDYQYSINALNPFSNGSWNGYGSPLQGINQQLCNVASSQGGWEGFAISTYFSYAPYVLGSGGGTGACK